MKALKEIGFRKATKFGWTTFLLIIYRIMIFPQLRSMYLRMLGVKIGRHTIIHRVDFFNLYRKGFRGMEIGYDCFLGDGSLFDLADSIKIGDKVTIAERVTILTHTNVGFHDHPLQSQFPPFSKPVRIGYGSFIGACVTILPGVQVGKCAFVAAGSVVTRDVADNHLVAGVPARKLRRLKTEA
jgi:acetyltransferase-like isoleucine patch superfamily enzyme